jgi:hypothetical protein
VDLAYFLFTCRILISIEREEKLVNERKRKRENCEGRSMGMRKSDNKKTRNYNKMTDEPQSVRQDLPTFKKLS